MELHTCAECGLVQILDPIDPEILYKGFNYNFSSWKPEPHMEAELDTIMSRGPYESVFEIGCNDGLFLQALKDRGVDAAIGLEPNAVPGKLAKDRGLAVIESWVTPAICRKAVEDNAGRFDLVVSRQVIEHVLDLDNFFACIDELLSGDGWLFLDMPDFELGMKTGDCSTVWEEHVSYFSAPVLALMLKRHGFSAVRHDWYDFSSGALAVLARRTASGELPIEDQQARVPEIIEMARGYENRLLKYGGDLKAALSRSQKKGAEVALYGVGVRGCCAVNGLRLAVVINFAVDDQSERQGKFMPGSRLPIHPPSALTESNRPLVVLMAVNNENEKTVEEKVRAMTDRPMSFLSLCSPTDIGTELAAFERPC